MAHKPVGATRLHATVGRDDPERAPKRSEACKRDHQTAELNELARELRQATAYRPGEEHGEASDRCRDPRKRPQADVRRLAAHEEQGGGPPLEQRRSESRGCAGLAPVREVRPGENREQRDEQSSRGSAATRRTIGETVAARDASRHGPSDAVASKEAMRAQERRSKNEDEHHRQDEDGHRNEHLHRSLLRSFFSVDLPAMPQVTCLRPENRT